MKTNLISITKGSGKFNNKSIEDIIVYAARVSSSRDINEKFKDTAGLLKYCINHHHWSVFETGSVTFEIETSKATGIQLIRHRSFTFQEFSQRYQDVNKVSDDDMFEPIEIRKQATNNRQSSAEVFNPLVDYSDYTTAYDLIQEALATSQNVYDCLIKNGVAREQARMILPLVTKTKIYMTGSIRSWIHFLQIRDDIHAQKEIRLIAQSIKKQLIKELPIISKALEW